ncbi:Methionine ABC transporter permease protein [Streptococcus sp. DD12]|nr:Methionine ABC transporter permease protein [Streptococcus sp. DD12]
MLEWIKTYLPNVYAQGFTGDGSWLEAIGQTLYMTFVAFLIGGALGLIAGLFLVLTKRGGVIPNNPFFQALDKIVSVFRAIPFIILLAILSPLTLLLVGTNLGATAALVPLSAATFPFFARQVQVVLSEMDNGVIEAAQASGATFWDIVGIYLSECTPELIRVSTVTLISLVGETAMAGAIGSGGLGTMAIKGFNYFQTDMTWVATILIVLLIFLIQFVGDTLSKVVSHR